MIESGDYPIGAEYDSTAPWNLEDNLHCRNQACNNNEPLEVINGVALCPECETLNYI